MRWKDKLINDFLSAIEQSTNLDVINVAKSIRNQSVSLHLAIFNEPFLSLILSGRKTMESRFSMNNVIPYRKVAENDIVLIKKSAGPIIGFFTVETVNFFSNLSARKVSALEHEFGNYLGWNIDPDFITNKSTAKYLTLVNISMIVELNPIETTKADRTGWSIVKLGLQNTLFEYGTEEN